LRKTPIFFAENRQKSHKIVIITSIPGQFTILQPQKLNRLRTKISESKKPDVPVEPPKKAEPLACDSAIHDCDGCAVPKHARNCRVKYFKDQVTNCVVRQRATKSE
jgi:hypothetical protein